MIVLAKSVAAKILNMFGVSHTRLATMLQTMYDPKFCQSYSNRKNSAQLVLKVVEIIPEKSVSAKFLNMFKTSHLRF